MRSRYTTIAMIAAMKARTLMAMAPPSFIPVIPASAIMAKKLRGRNNPSGA
jgi:hypothetical protein